MDVSSTPPFLYNVLHPINWKHRISIKKRTGESVLCLLLLTNNLLFGIINYIHRDSYDNNEGKRFYFITIFLFQNSLGFNAYSITYACNLRVFYVT